MGSCSTSGTVSTWGAAIPVSLSMHGELWQQDSRQHTCTWDVSQCYSNGYLNNAAICVNGSLAEFIAEQPDSTETVLSVLHKGC